MLNYILGTREREDIPTITLTLITWNSSRDVINTQQEMAQLVTTKIKYWNSPFPQNSSFCSQKEGKKRIEPAKILKFKSYFIKAKSWINLNLIILCSLKFVLQRVIKNWKRIPFQRNFGSKTFCNHTLVIIVELQKFFLLSCWESAWIFVGKKQISWT